MTDLTKITTPFGLLDENTRRALKECGGPWEQFRSEGWQKIVNPTMWFETSTYRQAEKRETVTGEVSAWRNCDGVWWLVPIHPKGTGEHPGISTTTLINGKPVRIVWTADGYEGDGE